MDEKKTYGDEDTRTIITSSREKKSKEGGLQMRGEERRKNRSMPWAI